MDMTTEQKLREIALARAVDVTLTARRLDEPTSAVADATVDCAKKFHTFLTGGDAKP